MEGRAPPLGNLAREHSERRKPPSAGRPSLWRRDSRFRGQRRRPSLAVGTSRSGRTPGSGVAEARTPPASADNSLRPHASRAKTAPPAAALDDERTPERRGQAKTAAAPRPREAWRRHGAPIQLALRRKPQHAEPDADRLFPGERFGGSAQAAPCGGAKGPAGFSSGVASPPKVAAIRSAAIRT